MSGKSKPSQVAVAACSFELQVSGGRVQLLPGAEEFRSIDGRPAECKAWVCNADIARRLVADLAARKNPLVIDYDHQTLRAKENGQPAPAAGWWDGFEWVPGQGGFATGVQWTDRAAQMIANKEYRFISPVFAYDPKTGAVLKIVQAALTNDPALDGMAEIAALSVALNTNQGEAQVDEELLERLRWFLNLPITATPDEMKAELDKLRAMLTPAGAQAAASFDLVAHITGRDTTIAALTADLGNEAKFVPATRVTELQGQIATLSSELATFKTNDSARELDGVVTAALSSGRLLPALEGWARDLGKTNLAALQQYVAAAPIIPALLGTQSGGREPGGENGTGVAFLSAQGFSVDETKLDIHNRALAHMSKNPGTDYVAAVKSVAPNA